MLLRQKVQRTLEAGPAFFLKADQLEGRSWRAFATSIGLSPATLHDLLIEIGATGEPILYVDAIDRIEKDNQPVILDVLRTIMDSPLLESWKIVLTLRDTGIEPIRNWMGDLLNAAGVATVEVDVLGEEDAEALALAKPHLRNLLFGAPAVREIVRRPFFAKILNQSFVGASEEPEFAPQSEVDLIENWWARGGYDAAGQEAIDRQRAIVELAGVRARNLSRPISLNKLSAPAVGQLAQFIEDGILQTVRPGHTVRFAHDIFFEWAFFEVLTDRGDDWLDEIVTCGEPPAVGRIVELMSQWEYAQNVDWTRHLTAAATANMRSQWVRAWLLGPVGASNFAGNESQFAKAVFADDFAFLKKALVWYQAEKTTPNPNILTGNLSSESQLRFADLLGWPSDFAAWGRFVSFLLRHVATIPANLYADIVSVFEVWQNALAEIPNPRSKALLTQCSAWLNELASRSSAEKVDANSKWKGVAELGDLKQSMAALILRAAPAEAALAQGYLESVLNSDRISKENFEQLISYAPVLGRSLPKLLVDITLKHLLDELPDDQIARERAEAERSAENRRRILAIPENERTRNDNLVLSGVFSRIGYNQFSSHDWESLAIDRGASSFWPPSPLREPFHSLFRSSPIEALSLVRTLCNHATEAWRQLHRRARDSEGTPVGLLVTFPWGPQTFWGGQKEYQWFRGLRAPKPLASAFLAMEDWVFSEVERGVKADDLIHQIVGENVSIAILGVAATIAMATDTISDTVFPLVTSQRLLKADYDRFTQDLTAGNASLMGFDARSDQAHIDAVRRGNARDVRKMRLDGLLQRFFVMGGEAFSEPTRAAVLEFENALPYEFEEHRPLSKVEAYLRTQAREYAELVDAENYKAYATETPDEVAIMHVSPAASSPETVARAERARLYLQEGQMWMWASKSFETGTLGSDVTIAAALTLARTLDSDDLFGEENGRELGTRRGAVVGAAAITLRFRRDTTDEDRQWARAVINRATNAPETRDFMWSSGSIIPWHHAIFAARGLAADIKEGSAMLGADVALLELVAHPLEIVSLAALSEAFGLWAVNSRLSWAATLLGFSLCELIPRPRGSRSMSDPIHSESETTAAVATAVSFYNGDASWEPIPLPPTPWVKMAKSDAGGLRYETAEGDDDESDDLEDTGDVDQVWAEPASSWHHQFAHKMLPLVPIEAILSSSARGQFLDLASGLLRWTNSKNAPPWAKPGRRDKTDANLFEWTHSVGSFLGRASGHLPLEDVETRFLAPITALQGEACWSILHPFVETYVCAYVFDAPTTPDAAVAVLSLCLERFLASPELEKASYRRGEFSGFDQPRLARTLMFVSVEHAGGSARYVNGDWSEIGTIMPLIDRYVREAGWTSRVMSSFLTLCERAKSSYPTETFADQVLKVLEEDDLKGWHGSSIPARIAGLVQHFADRNTPMSLPLAQKFLRILDLLIDMGDRRSAALQSSEAFREVRIGV